jgi:hypothetical protein
MIFAVADDRIRSADRAYGYTLREIADHADCHYSTISRRLHNSERTA